MKGVRALVVSLCFTETVQISVVVVVVAVLLTLVAALHTSRMVAALLHTTTTISLGSRHHVDTKMSLHTALHRSLHGAFAHAAAAAFATTAHFGFYGAIAPGDDEKEQHNL